MSSKSKLFYFIEIFWLLLLLTFASMVYLNQEFVNFFFNADILGFFNFFQDMFLNHVHYGDWSLSPAPHFFPDMLIFFPFLFLTKNIYYQFLITLWLMVIFTYFAVKFIYSQFFTKEKSVIFALAATSSFFLLALKGLSPYILALVPAVHVGEFIIGILFIGIQVKILNQEEISFNTYALLGISVVLSFSSSLSDLLFIPQFACSSCLAYTFLFLKNKLKFKQWIVFSNLAILPAIFGGFISKYLVPHAILFKYLNHPSIRKITLNTIIYQLHAVINIFKNINYVMSLFFIIFYINIFVILYAMTFKKVKEKYFFNFKKSHIFIISFIFFSIFSSVISIFPLCGVNYVLDRYIMPFYFFSFLLFFIPISSINNYNLISKISTTIVLGIFFWFFVSVFIVYNKQGFKLKGNYYPEDIRCIDNALRGQGRNGVAQYWTARPLSMLSKESLNVNQVLPNLSPFLQSANIKNKNFYSFAIIDTFSTWVLDQSLIESINGKPKKIIMCGDKKLLIYPENGLKIKKLI
ncbi:hypothetical protein [Rickettsiella endosymbiont of Aleochara curtula]|uniref:hypothetical protein n=1 Tax=Rickettsiella endosymbiont of Aleochara curtula TaxID=3077936 RepID=UPI00313BD342